MTATGNALNLRIRLAFWVLAAVLGFAQTWTSRLDADDNAVSYLDIGTYFLHGHHGAIINGFWSPLYALLIGSTVSVLKPSLYWEYPTVHLLVFIIFLFTMTCFDYFLRQSIQLRFHFDPEKRGSSGVDWVWITIGYTIFLWSSLKLIGVNKISPDMLVAGFFYLSCGLLATIATDREKWETFLNLGLMLGLSYLAKLALLPICLLILVIVWLIAKQKARYVLVSAIVFVALAAPFIVALSVQKGRFTYGEVTTYEYAVNVNGIPHYHWQGDSKMPLAHPTRQIFAAPATFEFREPFKGTYPPQYDISYWYAGVKPQVHFRQEIKVLATNLFWELITLIYAMNGVVLTTLFIMFFQTGRGWLILKDILRYWFLIVPCLATAGLYAFAYYNPQYLAGTFVVLLLCLFLSAAVTLGLPSSRLLSGVAVLQFVMFLALVGFPLLLHVLDIHVLHPRVAEKASYQEVAEKAYEMGLRPGDQIASLNASNAGMSMWAHLARLQIIAEVYCYPVYYDPGLAEATAANNFWNADPPMQERVIQKLSRTGALAIISQDTPVGSDAGRWLEIGTTGYYLYWLKPADKT